MDSDKVCGICLQESSDMSSIFDRDPDLQLTILDKITKCFPDFGDFQDFQDKQHNDQRIRKICEFCLLDLDSAFRFRNHCETSSLLLFRCSPVSEEREGVPKMEDDSSGNTAPTEYHVENVCDLEQMNYDEEHLDDIVETQDKPPSEDGNKKTNLTRLKTPKVQTFKPASKEKSSSSPKICEICGNTYKYQHALNSHMRRHMNDKPFSCECCDKAFVSNVELRRHMRVHTGDKPYSCSYCERKFSDFGSRIKHERTHTGERPFTCQTCHKSFAYAHVLSVHLRTHTGEKKFQCSQCEKGFTKKSYMLAHLEQHRRSAVLILKEEEEEGESSYDAYLQQGRPIYGTVIKDSTVTSLEPSCITYIVEEIDGENNEIKDHRNIEELDEHGMNLSAESENILGIE